MKIVDINGVYKTSSVDELGAVLTKRYGDGYNSFWLSHDDAEYPTLSVLVKDDLATLNFLPKEFEAGLSSTGHLPKLAPGETMTFPISNNPADDIVVLNEAVVSFSVALQGVKDFFFLKELPRSVEWREL